MKRKCFHIAFSATLLALGVAISPMAPGRVSFAETNEVVKEQQESQASDAVSDNASDSSTTQLTEAEQAAKELEEARLALQKDPNHVHKFRWIAKMNESESAEGTNNYICTECGKIWFFRPISPYYAFQGDVAYRIETAPEGATVRVKTSHYINFNRQVMTALSQRPDVSVYVSFLDQEYKGDRVSFVIPAGEDVLSLLDQNGFAGFLFLGGKYGLTVEERMVIPEPIPSTAEGSSDSSSETSEEATTNE